MSDANPPPDVAAAARVVQSWLEQQKGDTTPPARKMTDAERLDHCRKFDQTKMPDWKDPRGG